MRLHPPPLGERFRRLRATVDVGERVRRRKPERGRAVGTASPVGGGASCLQLRQDLAREFLTTSERQPEGGEPVQLDLSVLARAFGVREQPLDPRAPVAGVEVQLARQMLDRMPVAGFISDTRRQLLRAEYDVLGIGYATALDQECPE